MVSPRVKGRNAELAFKAMMEEKGWRVILVQPPKKYNKENDFCNLFDAICLKGPYQKWVQIKCNRKPPLKEYTAWGEEFGNEFIEVEVWVKIDRKGWKAHTAWSTTE